MTEFRTPWDAPPEAEQGVARLSGPALQDVRLRFGVKLRTFERANLFANHFRTLFPRSGITVSEGEEMVWIIFRCGAVDGRDATIQCAVAIRTTAEHRLVRESPSYTYFHDVEQLGPVPPHELLRVTRDREEALRRAALWGMLHRLVGDIAPEQIEQTGEGGPTATDAAASAVSARRLVPGSRLPARRSA